MEASFYGLVDRIPDLLICGNVDVLSLVSIVYIFFKCGQVVCYVLGKPRHQGLYGIYSARG